VHQFSREVFFRSRWTRLGYGVYALWAMSGGSDVQARAYERWLQNI